MTRPARRGMILPVVPLLIAMSARNLSAQAHASAPQHGRGVVALDTNTILESARAEIDAANAAWLPGLRRHDAKALAAAYAYSGVFIAPDGAVTRGRGAIALMYAARFPKLPSIRDGAVTQGGMIVLSQTRIAEWGEAWLESAPTDTGPSVRKGGSYLTIWQREPDGHWRIARNLAF